MYSAVCRNNLSPKPNRSATRRYALRSPVVGVVSTVPVTGELLSIADIVGFALIFAASASVLLAPSEPAKA